MIDTQYMKSCTEVLEILKSISKEDYNKIPSDIINVLENSKDEKYYFKYDKNKTLDEQNVLGETKIIIAILFRDYWATEVQRERILKIQKEERQKIEDNKRIKFPPNEIFKKDISKIDENARNEIYNESKHSIEIKKDNFFMKIKNKSKSIFHITN